MWRIKFIFRIYVLSKWRKISSESENSRQLQNWSDKIAKYSDPYAIEITIDSKTKNENQSWNGISRDVNKYLAKLFEEIKKSTHYEKASSSTDSLVEIRQKEQLISSSFSSSTLSIDQR